MRRFLGGEVLLTDMTKQEGRKLIVLVEDEQTLANLIEMNLMEAGYEVKVAGNGIDGLALIKKFKPDLVLLDMLLPGKSGFSVLEELSDEGILPGLKVVIISNSGQPVETERAVKLGAIDYLVKVNFSPQEVVSKVGLALANDSPVSSAKSDEQKLATILIIEDDALLHGVLKSSFADKGWKVVGASNAAKARDILSSEVIDFILLDIRLPDEDGISFLKEIKGDKKWQDIPVIIVSNLGQQEEVERGLEAGAIDYLVKANFFPNEIVDKVTQAMAVV